MRIMAEEVRAYGVTSYSRARWIARQRRSGVAGISRWRMPNGERASTSALPTAGRAPTLAASTEPVVKRDVLHQHLAPTLRNAAADLAFEQQRVHHRADIVDDAVTQDLDGTRLLVDLELADIAGGREGLILSWR